MWFVSGSSKQSRKSGSVMSTTSVPVDRERFRNVLGHVPTGVVVITATGEGRRPMGMAVGSFTSVSLDPPLVAFLPAMSSTTFPAIWRSGSFCANVLGADQEQLSRRFAVSGGDKFQGVGWRSAASGSPVIDDVIAWIDCDIEQVTEAGDHYLVLGRVTGLEEERWSSPLLFFRSGYHRIASS
jgi:3-hydroxy-9,10-secoandrosta-1,3,5(10)-triene-9,17-dione monooxygenase reductase component